MAFCAAKVLGPFRWTQANWDYMVENDQTNLRRMILDNENYAGEECAEKLKEALDAGTNNNG